MSAVHELSAHAHHHDEDQHNRSGERRTRWVVAITALMMVGELTIGWLSNSMALTADGWHMGTHVGALGLTLVAYWYARTRADTDVFSFGTGKVYALAGYTSGVLLALVALWIAVEGIIRLVRHDSVGNFDEAIVVAAVGLGVNVVSAVLLGSHHHYGHDHAHGGDAHDDHAHDDHAHAGHAHAGHAHDDHAHDDHAHDDHAHDDHAHDDHAHDHDDHAADARFPHDGLVHRPVAGTLDFNLRAAYIHILADALTSVLAIAALTLGKYAGLWFLDPLMGPIGGAVIVWWSISLCKQAGRQLLDVVSSPTHEQVVRARLQAIDDVRVADLHVWELGPGRRSCIVSIVTATPRELVYYRDAVLAALDVAHLTIEIHQCELPHHDAPQVAHAHEH